MDPPYPAHWEADVVLRDGGTAHVRPIRPDDAPRLVRFHTRLSDQTLYFRYFSVYRTLSERDLVRFTHVDHVERIALVATVGEEVIGVVRCDKVAEGEAEVAFNIEDAYQGRGLGSVFLEHIAAAARERGITRFVADVLPANRQMLHVFQEAGYVVGHQYDDGVVRLEFPLEPTETSVAVMRAREHRAEARSVERLLRPGSVAVVGAGRSSRSLGHVVLRHVLAAGFRGTVVAVNPHVTELDGVPAYPSVRAVPHPVDVAVVAVPAAEVERVVEDCAAKQVRGLVVVSSGFAETGPEGRDRQRRLVRLARANGMRVVGPSSFGIINTDPQVALNGSLAPVLPPGGRAGFFSQSGALGVALLDNLAQRGLGLSTFVSAGNRVDVSGNDLLQFWEDDPATDVVMLYLESFGNPRKFSRIARRLAARKPVAVVKSGGATGSPPSGHVVRPSRAPAAAVQALLAQAGVMSLDNIHQLFDVGQLLAHQPLPAGPRLAVVGNSSALGALAAGAAAEAGLLVVGAPVDLGAAATAADFAAALDAVLGDDGVDCVAVLYVPPLVAPDADVAAVLAERAGRGAKTVVSTFRGLRGVPDALRAPEGPAAVPSYATPEDAVRALATVARYAAWRAADPGRPVQPDVDVAGARAAVAAALEAQAGRDDEGLDQQRLSALLRCYGIDVWPVGPAPDVETAVRAAARIGYPVALKTLAPHLRHRSDLGGVRLDVHDEADLRGAYAAMSRRLGPGATEHFVVQAMAPAGVACVLGSVEDPLIGPVVSFGLAGVATELLGDLAYRIPPLTDVDVAALVRSVRAAPLLFGHRGTEPVDVAALEDLLARVSRLADDLPEVAELELNPVVVSTTGLAVLSARARLTAAAARTDRGPRALPG